jgi:hypothetical protein
MDSSNRQTPAAALHTSTAGQQFAFKKKEKEKEKTEQASRGPAPFRLHQSNSHLVLIRPSL